MSGVIPPSCRAERTAGRGRRSSARATPSRRTLRARSRSRHPRGGLRSEATTSPSGAARRTRDRLPARPPAPKPYGRRSCGRDPISGPAPFSGESFLERDPRLPADLAPNPRRVSRSARRVSLATWRPNDLEASSRDRAERLDGLEHGHLRAAADVERRARAPPFHGVDRRVDRVVDVREAPRLRPVAEELEGAVLGQRRHHARERHVGALSRSGDREVPERDDAEAELLPVRLGEVLACELRDPIRRKRPWNGVLWRRKRRSIPVNRRRGREHCADTSPGRRLEETLTREDVLANVDGKHAPEALHTRLSGEVEDAVNAVEPERVDADVDPLDREAARVLLLQLRVVVVGEGIPARGVVPPVEERPQELRAHEAGGAP